MSDLHVVKVGGSLLEWENLERALQRWLASQSPARVVFVVGGGAPVDELRRYDQLHDLDAGDVHWAAVKIMSATAKVVASMLPGCPVVTRLKDIPSTSWPESTVVLDPYPFLRLDEPACPGTKLAENWDVTSDSIAARLAEVSGAARLWLLKSSLPPGGLDWQAAADIGFIDPEFPSRAARLPCVLCVNLREASFPVWTSAGTEHTMG